MIVVDNFVRDVFLLHELRNDQHWQRNIPYTWYDKDTEQIDIWIKLARFIWNFNHQFQNLGEYEGFEMWTQCIESRGLDWHRDKDEYLKKHNNELVTPLIGSIWYAHTDQIIGGNLQIHNDSGIQTIHPVPNRLVIFDVSQRHRVTFTNSGHRRSVMFNVWKCKPDPRNFGPVL